MEYEIRIHEFVRIFDEYLSESTQRPMEINGASVTTSIVNRYLLPEGTIVQLVWIEQPIEGWFVVIEIATPPTSKRRCAIGGIGTDREGMTERTVEARFANWLCSL